MDLIQISGTVRRHKWVTIPIVALTLIALVYVAAVKPKPYTADAAYMLVPPATATTTDPNGNTENNPYVRFGDLSVIVDMLTEQMSSNPIHAQIVKDGADPNFAVAADADYEGSPILEVTGNGPSAAAADASTQVAGSGAVTLLTKLQDDQGVTTANRITMMLLEPPNATLKASSLVRSAAVVLIIGGLVLAMALSFASGIEDIRRRSKQAQQKTADISKMERPDPLPLDESLAS